MELTTPKLWRLTLPLRGAVFDKGQPLVFLSPYLQPPLFMDTQEQLLEISIKWEFSVLHMSKSLYQNVSRTNLNIYNCYMMKNIGCKDSDSSFILQYNKRTAPLFLAISCHDSHCSAAVRPQLVPFSRPSTPPPQVSAHLSVLKLPTSHSQLSPIFTRV